MRDVLKQTPFARHEALDSGGHIVEGRRELADLVLTSDVGACGEFTAAELLNDMRELVQGANDVGDDQREDKRDGGEDAQHIRNEVTHTIRRPGDRHQAVHVVLRGRREDDLIALPAGLQ